MKVPQKFSLPLFMAPVWEGNTVYYESIQFFPHPVTKEIQPAPLLYVPEEILAVYSSDLATEYHEGEDFTLVNGQLELTENTTIPIWSYDEYYPVEPAEFDIKSVSAPGRHVRFDSGVIHAEKQLAVTYRHSGEWQGIRPPYTGEQLSVVTKKLTDQQPVTIVYYGDSIMTGADASGSLDIAPYMPIFPDLVTEQLKASYGYHSITTHNTAVGGTTTQWGVEETPQRVALHRPDLVVVNFGMNDASTNLPIEEYEENLRQMIALTRKESPKAEFLLLSSTVPNPDCDGWTRWHARSSEALCAIARDTAGVAVLPMTEVQAYLLEHKRYDDMNGNAVNHPNDFMARVFAQVIAQALIKSW